MLDPTLIGSAISGGASLLGGLFGGRANKTAQDRANETNLQIARETNQNQYQIFQEQNAFNERMWNTMNAYNTPAMQMQRYKDAGINPYIAAGNVQTGNPASAMSSASAPAQHAAVMQPATGMGDAVQNSFTQVGNVISQFAQNELALSQAQKNRAEAGWVDRLNGAQLGNINADTLKKHNESSLLGTDYQLKSSTLGNYIRLSDLSVQNAEKTNEQIEVLTQSARLENALKNINLGIQSKHGEDMFRSILAKNVAEAFAIEAGVHQRDRQLQIDKQNADTNAANAATNRMNAATNRMNAHTNAAVGAAQIQSLISSSIKTAEETSGIKIDNKTKAQLNQAILQGLGLDNIDKKNKNSAFWWNFAGDKFEQFSRIGVNGTQMYKNMGDGTNAFVRSVLPFF